MIERLSCKPVQRRDRRGRGDFLGIALGPTINDFYIANLVLDATDQAALRVERVLDAAYQVPNWNLLQAGRALSYQWAFHFAVLIDSLAQGSFTSGWKSRVVEASHIRVVVDWGALDVDRETQVFEEPQASATVLKLVAALIAEFGASMSAQLREIPVLRYPLSDTPREAFGGFSSIQVPGTNLYFCPQSSSAEKVRRLTELFGRLVLPDDRVFPEGSIEVTLVES